MNIEQVKYGSDRHEELRKLCCICSTCHKNIDKKDPAFENNMCTLCFAKEFSQDEEK